MLTAQRIAELASRPNVKTVSVENFLSTLYDVSYEEAAMNCEMDAQCYGWNIETKAAIREGLAEHFRR